MRMHDVWIMFCGLIHGNVIYDHIPAMDYRRHGNNATNGAIQAGVLSRYFIKLDNLINHQGLRNMRSRTAKILLESFEDKLNIKEKNELKLILNSTFNWKDKIELIKRMDLFIDMGEPMIATWLRVLLGRV